MSSARIARAGLACSVCVCALVTPAAPAAPGQRPDGAGPDLDVHAPVTLTATDARVRALSRDGRVVRLYGEAFSGGASAVESAEAFLAADAAALGTTREDLVALGPFEDGRHLQPIMHDAATGTSRFTGVYYTQQRGGVPVFRARLLLLVRNEPGFPLVLASADLRDLDRFRPDPALVALVADVDADPGVETARRAWPALDSFTAPATVIWAGVDDMLVAPVLARTFIGEGGDSGAPDHQRRLFVTDARTGAMLHEEDQILHTDLSGTVKGLATEGMGAEICGPEPPMGLPYALVSSRGGSDYTDADGNWVIEDAGDEPIDVKSYLRGLWFEVFNQAEDSGWSTVLLEIVTPPGPLHYLHNEDNTELTRAEVNCYLHANIARDYALSYSPDYPVIRDQAEYRINVNIDLNCNATYSGTAINFYTSGGGCPNTGFSSVVYHEYGHHLVSTGGSGQGAYGEGMADILSVLIFDHPILGLGFRGNCSEGLRSADNGCRYRSSGCSTCGDEVHACGRLLSGCVWSTRDELRATNPDTYLDILSALAINSILLHGGSSITPAITVDFLVLDDDNGTLLDGTPHYAEIAAGFGDHDMDAPELTCGGDLDDSGAVDVGDLVAIIAAWGPCPGCPEDLDESGAVDAGDLVLLLRIWGPCP